MRCNILSKVSRFFLPLDSKLVMCLVEALRNEAWNDLLICPDKLDPIYLYYECFSNLSPFNGTSPSCKAIFSCSGVGKHEASGGVYGAYGNGVPGPAVAKMKAGPVFPFLAELLMNSKRMEYTQQT